MHLPLNLMREEALYLLHFIDGLWQLRETIQPAGV